MPLKNLVKYMPCCFKEETLIFYQIKIERRFFIFEIAPNCVQEEFNPLSHLQKEYQEIEYMRFVSLRMMLRLKQETKQSKRLFAKYPRSSAFTLTK